MLAAGARPKDTKVNLMDCICLFHGVVTCDVDRDVSTAYC